MIEPCRTGSRQRVRMRRADNRPTLSHKKAGQVSYHKDSASISPGERMTNRAAIYARVSTDDQAANYSLPTQVEACQLYAVEKGFEIVAEFREDYTGSELDRPELNDLRELAGQGAIEW